MTMYRMQQLKILQSVLLFFWIQYFYSAASKLVQDVYRRPRLYRQGPNINKWPVRSSALYISIV